MTQIRRNSGHPPGPPDGGGVEQVGGGVGAGFLAVRDEAGFELIAEALGVERPRKVR